MQVVNMNWKVPYEVYGGRPRHGTDPRQVKINHPGWLGNPFVIDEDGDRAEVLRKFKIYFWRRLNDDSMYRAAILELKNKTVACFCKPKACHLDVIANFLVWVDTRKGKKWLRTVQCS